MKAIRASKTCARIGHDWPRRESQAVDLRRCRRCGVAHDPARRHVTAKKKVTA